MTVQLRTPTLFVVVALFCSATVFAQGTKPAPPRTAKPPAKAAPAPKKPEPTPAVVAPPPPPPAEDVHFKSTYTNGDQVTESVTYIRGPRERYVLGDTVLLKQHDQNRVVQSSRASNTYLITAEGAAPMVATAPAPPGIINVGVSIVDLGDRKQAFGSEARHVRSVIDRQPQAGACDTSRIRIETDGWYIDMPKAMNAPPEKAAAPAGCADEIKTTETGDPKLLGFPISYNTTFTDPDAKDVKPIVTSMEVNEFEIVRLDEALFEIPVDLKQAANARELARAISDANEVKLATDATAAAAPAKKPGVLRVGVPEVTNKTTQTVDTRALRARLVAELEDQKFDVVPMAAADPATLEARAKELSVDYLLLAEISDLKASKPGGITKIMKTTAKESTDKDVTEAKLNVQLLPPGGKPRLTKSSSGKDGGIGLKTGLGLARFAGTLYLRMYLGGGYSSIGAMSNMQMMRLGGMGNPALYQLQSGLGATRYGGSGVDRTAGAAMFVMQTAMAAAGDGGSQGGPSFDAALTDAIQDAGKEVVDSLKKSTVKK
jgi:hypothetical protein